MEYFNIERFYLKKLNVAEGEEECENNVSNGFAALKNFDVMNISTA
jgi:hypothetical protein